MSSPRDTISSANAYYNNQFRLDPGFVQGYAKIHTREMKDTLETKQQRLERHLETQFNLNQQVPSGKIVLIAQVGKYAILAFVMPPFYLFYEGPRWILITIQPFVQVAFEKVGAILLLISTFGIDIWAGLGKKLQVFKKPKDFVKEKFKNFSNALAKRVEVLGQKLHQVFQPVNQAMEKFKSYIPAFQEKKASFVHFLKILPRLLQKKLEGQKDQFKAKFDIFKTFVTKIATQVQIPFIAAQKVLNPVVNTVKSQVSIITKPALNLSTAVFEIAKNAARKIAQQSKVIGNAIAVPFNIALKAIEAPIKTAFKRVEGVIKASASVAKEQVAKLSNVTTAALMPVQRGFVQVKTFAEQSGLSLIQKTKIVLNRLKKMEPVIRRVIKTVWDEGKKHAKKGFAKFKKTAVASTQALVKGVSWGIQKIALIPSKLFTLWKKFQKWIRHITKKTIWALRLTLAWTKVLLRHALARLWN